MSKKIISLVLALLLCITAAALAEETENPMDMAGYWMDSWSQRANMTITYDGEHHKAVIRWSGSAFESIQWEMTGVFENGMLTTDNCRKTSHFFSEDGSEDIVVHYENEKASLRLADGAVLFSEPEGMSAECRFERYTDLDLSTVFNPERYAHLYVTSAAVMGDALCLTGIPGTIHENGTLSGFQSKDRLMLPLSSACEIRLPDGSSDLSAWFSSAGTDEGFYAIFRLNEQGEITKLIHNEEQPAAPVIEKEPAPEVMIVPAPPTRR